MSRAGAQASKERRRVDAEYRRIDELARADMMLAACEACGLEQVQPPFHPLNRDETAAPGLPPAGTVCVLCGNETARFLTSDLGSP